MSVQGVLKCVREKNCESTRVWGEGSLVAAGLVWMGVVWGLRPRDLCMCVFVGVDLSVCKYCLGCASFIQSMISDTHTHTPHSNELETTTRTSHALSLML